jgi:hypothetical protein
MCSYYKGLANGIYVEAETESQFFRLASMAANKAPRNRDVLFFDFVRVEEDMRESTPLPQQYCTRLKGRKWQHHGNTPAGMETHIPEKRPPNRADRSDR